MNIKIHKTRLSTVVALCDIELVGKKVEEDNMCIDITERFYKGEDLQENEVIKILKDADSINVVGDKSIQTAFKANVIKEYNIKKIKGIPFAISV